MKKYNISNYIRYKEDIKKSMPVDKFYDYYKRDEMIVKFLPLVVFGLALFSTALAYILYFRILATAGATNLLLVTFLIPISAILLGALFLEEQLALKDFTGMGLICLGLVAIDGRLFGFLRKKTSGKSISAPLVLK